MVVTSIPTRKKDGGGGTSAPIMCMMMMMMMYGSSNFVRVVSSLPMTVTVNPRSKECLYDYVEENESVTISIFILTGAELKGGLILEGPLSSARSGGGGGVLNSGLELQEMVNRHEQHGSGGGRQMKTIQEDVDFERMIRMVEADQYYNDDDDYGAGDDDMNLWLQEDDDKDDDEGLPEEQLEIRSIHRRKRALLEQQKAIVARRRKAQRMMANNIVKDGEPIQRTINAGAAAGWYRACVKGTWYEITAELEMRKSSDLGGVDVDTGHVFSYVKQEELLETEFLESDSPNEEEVMLKNEDFNTTKYQLERLRHLLIEIREKQGTERHRLVVHAATNQHSHSRMVLSSLFQTILFMAVTGFQVYTVRKWFSSDADNALLGR